VLVTGVDIPRAAPPPLSARRTLDVGGSAPGKQGLTKYLPLTPDH